MIRSAITALLLGGLYAPLVFAAGGIPVVDRTGQPGVDASAASPVPSNLVSSPPRSQVVPVAAPVVSVNAELFMMLDQLQEEVRFLRGQVEQQQHQLQRIQVDQRDRYRDLDRRLSLLSQRSISAPTVVASTLPSALPSSKPESSVVGTRVATQVTVSRSADSAPAVSDAQAYKDAFSLVRERNFDKALSAFEGFLQQYPESELTANVLYWTGEVHRAKPLPDQQKASLAYQQLVTRYPSHPKAADAYYKLGLAYQQMGQLDKAKASMTKVIELFPNQAPATLARDYLKQNR
tara:strand:- start:494 stop:1369 length:876 start_codon:yes stop_codon:yes gene_type:complete